MAVHQFVRVALQPTATPYQLRPQTLETPSYSALLGTPLIEHLNGRERERAVLPDVAQAVAATLESWESYFADLWERTSPPERACLLALLQNGQQLPPDYAAIAQLAGLDTSATRQAVQKLVRRDLLHQPIGGGEYLLAVPLLVRWIEQNS